MTYYIVKLSIAIIIGNNILNFIFSSENREKKTEDYEM